MQKKLENSYFTDTPEYSTDIQRPWICIFFIFDTNIAQKMYDSYFVKS